MARSKGVVLLFGLLLVKCVSSFIEEIVPPVQKTLEPVNATLKPEFTTTSLPPNPTPTDATTPLAPPSPKTTTFSPDLPAPTSGAPSGTTTTVPAPTSGAPSGTTTTVAAPTDTTSTTDASTSPEQVCENTITNCTHYTMATCHNPIYRSFLQPRCALYCGYCKPSAAQIHDNCVDKLPNCNDYEPTDGTKLCELQSYFIWAFENCKRYCNLGECAHRGN